MEIGNWSREKAEKIRSENKLEKSVTDSRTLPAEQHGREEEEKEGIER